MGVPSGGLKETDVRGASVPEVSAAAEPSVLSARIISLFPPPATLFSNSLFRTESAALRIAAHEFHTPAPVFHTRMRADESSMRADDTHARPDGTSARLDGSDARPDGDCAGQDDSCVRLDGTFAHVDGSLARLIGSMWRAIGGILAENQAFADKSGERGPRNHSMAGMFRLTRQLGGQIKLVVNQNVHTNASRASVKQENRQRRLTCT